MVWCHQRYMNPVCPAGPTIPKWIAGGHLGSICPVVFRSDYIEIRVTCMLAKGGRP